MHVSVKMRIEGTALISLSEGFTRFRLVEIQFSSLEQAIAVRDVIEHRIQGVPRDITLLPELEVDEVLDLVAFHRRIEALIATQEQE